MFERKRKHRRERDEKEKAWTNKTRTTKDRHLPMTIQSPSTTLDWSISH